MTTEELAAFARGHLADHPEATAQDVFKAIREGGYRGVLQSFQVHQACETVRPTPTLATVEEAVTVIRELVGQYEWVSVFWDRGWGDSGEVAQISVIVDGDGQMPLAWLTREVYDELLNSGVIKPNSLNTFKARRLHDFAGAVAE